MIRIILIALLISLVLCSLAPAQDAIAVPTDQASAWKLAAKEAAVEANVAVTPEGPGGKPCVKLSFAFTGTTHQWAILEGKLPSAATSAYRAIRVTYRTELPKPLSSFWLLLHTYGEKDYAAPVRLPASEQWTTLAVPLNLFAPAAWVKDAAPGVTAEDVQSLRFAVDGKSEGAGEGVLLVSQAALVKALAPGETFPPRVWTKSFDKAGEMTIATPAEGPEGAAVTRIDYTLPGGKHTFVFGNTKLNPGEAAGMKNLRLTYKSALPEGIAALRLLLIEKSGEAFTTTVQPSTAWQTVTLPLSSFTFGSWSKADNKQLDLDQLELFGFGEDGTIKAEKGTGTIWLAGFEFLP